MKKIVVILILAIAFLTLRCANKDGKDLQITGNSKLDNYMKSVEEQSNIIKNFLEYDDALTQVDMNVKSQELYELWDEALNYLWDELKNTTSEEEFAELLKEQRIWILEKENALKEAGKDVKGGSLYALIVNLEGTKITEERVYELYRLLK